MHLGPVAVLQNTATIHVSYEDRAPKLRHYYEPNGTRLRGSQVSVRLLGECGHSFDLILGFHKGQTSIWYERIEDRCFGDPEFLTPELWRD
jgi:hypothetical protein